MLRDGITEEDVYLHLNKDASDEEAALEADLDHIKWAIARVQCSIADMPAAPPPRALARGSTLGADTLGLDDSCPAGTERSLGAIDAAMRARGYSVPLDRSEEQQLFGAAAVVPCQPDLPPLGSHDPQQQLDATAAAAASKLEPRRLRAVGQAAPGSALPAAHAVPAVAGGSQVDVSEGAWRGSEGSPEQQRPSKLRRLRKALPSGAAAQPASGAPADGARAATVATSHLGGSLHSVPCDRDGRQGAASAAANADDQRHIQPSAGRKRGPSLVGQKVEVYWEADGKWYPGSAAFYNGKEGTHAFQYDDGELEELHMAEERWRLVNDEGPPPKPSRSGMAPAPGIPLPPRSGRRRRRHQRQQPSGGGKQIAFAAGAEAGNQVTGGGSGHEFDSSSDILEDDSSGSDTLAARQTVRRGPTTAPPLPPPGMLQPPTPTSQAGAAASAGGRDGTAVAAAPASRRSPPPVKPAPVAGPRPAMLDTQGAAELLTGLLYTAAVEAGADGTQAVGRSRSPGCSRRATTATQQHGASGGNGTARVAPASGGLPSRAQLTSVPEAQAAGGAPPAAGQVPSPRPAHTPGAALRTPAAGAERPCSIGCRPSGGSRSAHRTPALRRVSGSTTGGRTPEWWVSTLATTQRHNSPLGRATQGDPPSYRQPPDSEPLFACLPPDGPRDPPTRHATQTPSALRARSDVETPRTGQPGSQSLMKARGGRSPLTTLSQRQPDGRKRVISCSQLPAGQVKQLGRFATQMGTEFALNSRSTAPPEGTTHLVVNASRGQPARRTLKVLRAMLRGCWLLSWDWVIDSGRVGTWQPEADYEVQGVATGDELLKTDGPSRARQRHAQGKPKLLHGMEEAICLAASVTADAKPLSRNELEVLVHEAGGNLVTNLPAAVARAEQGACAATAAAVAAAAAAGGQDTQLCAPPQPAHRPTLYVLANGRDAAEAAELSGRAGVLVLQAVWLLDCISAMRILPTRTYELGS